MDENQQIKLKDPGGLTVKVTFDLPFCIYLEDGMYEVSRGNWLASVQLERIEQEHIDPRLGIDTASTDLVRDRHGLLRYSRVVIEMPGTMVIEEATRIRVNAGEIEVDDGVVTLNLEQDDLLEYHDVARQEALNVINRLIEVFRQITDSFHLKRIPMAEIFQSDTMWYHDDELIVGTHHSSFGNGMTLGITGVTPQTLDTLRGRLKSGEEVALPFELFMDAKDRLHRGEYRLAVVDARTALEVWVDKILLVYFQIQETSLESACQILDVRSGRAENLEDALQQAAINRKLGNALSIAVPMDLHNGYPKLWQLWLVAKDLREQGVHQGQEIDRTRAIDAVNTMGEIMGITREALNASTWFRAGDEQPER